VAGFVLPVRDRQVLLARHSYRFPATWLMVGGMAEPGEQLAATARREAREETGLGHSYTRLSTWTYPTSRPRLQLIQPRTDLTIEIEHQHAA
jgi:8-oxo-dGTP pyrophosphatase MutT (NUDIX family)